MTSDDDHSKGPPKPVRVGGEVDRSDYTAHSASLEAVGRAIRASCLGQALTASQALQNRVEPLLHPYRPLPLLPMIETAQHVGSIYQRFAVTPDIVRIGSALEGLHESQLMTAARSFGILDVNLQSRIARLNPVVLELASARDAIGGLVKLQTMGDLVRHPDSYSPNMVAAMRVELGDWRDQMQFREDTDRSSRETIYQDRGFDADLIDVDDDNFGEVVDTTGIRQSANLLEDTFGSFAPPALNARMANGELSQQAYQWLYTLECGLRRMIATVMEEAFGPKWPRQQIPGDMFDQWREKQRKAVQAGREQRPIIEYADFTDYVKIIERRDNWDQGFSKLWRRKEDVRESLQRLHWVRIETMHARILLKQDIILLYAEGQRLLQSARKVWPNGPG